MPLSSEWYEQIHFMSCNNGLKQVIFKIKQYMGQIEFCPKKGKYFIYTPNHEA